LRMDQPVRRRAAAAGPQWLNEAAKPSSVRGAACS